jgi:hypothetical protein
LKKNKEIKKRKKKKRKLRGGWSHLLPKNGVAGPPHFWPRGGFGHPHTAGMGWPATPISSPPPPFFNFFISKPLKKKKTLKCSKLRRFGQNDVVLGLPKTAFFGVKGSLDNLPPKGS